MIDKVGNDPDLLSKILYSDKATVTRDGVFNFHNNNQWSHERPPRHVYPGISRTICCECFGWFTWPYILPPHLNRQTYLIFLAEVLPELSEDVPLQTRINIWFQHDGAPVYWLQVRDLLDVKLLD